MIIAKGISRNPVSKLGKGGKHTLFLSSETPISARKHWIASNMNTKGEIIIDGGALKALQQGKSLLPAGVIDVKGRFDRGDSVAIKDFNMKLVGKGLSAYSSEDATLIMGQHSKEIENIIGFAGRNELIHSDDLVLEMKE